MNNIFKKIREYLVKILSIFGIKAFPTPTQKLDEAQPIVPVEDIDGSSNKGFQDVVSQHRSHIESEDTRGAYDYLVSHGRSLTTVEFDARVKGVIRDIRYYDIDSSNQPFAFIVNKNSLLFYLRLPAVKSGLFSKSRLMADFPDISENNRGEFTIRVRDEGMAKLISTEVLDRWPARNLDIPAKAADEVPEGGNASSLEQMLFHSSMKKALFEIGAERPDQFAWVAHQGSTHVVTIEIDHRDPERNQYSHETGLFHKQVPPLLREDGRSPHTIRHAQQLLDAVKDSYEKKKPCKALLVKGTKSGTTKGGAKAANDGYLWNVETVVGTVEAGYEFVIKRLPDRIQELKSA